MRCVLVADTYPPLRSSGAVQLRDLAREFIRQGHEITVILPTGGMANPYQIDIEGGVEVLRLKILKIKKDNYIFRALSELLMPFMLCRNFRKSPMFNRKWDGVIWYSPSIFLSPLANILKKSSGCRGYLIIRDIFPDWAIDMGLMSRGLAYYFFSAVARYQYSVADIVGVQSPSNKAYFSHWHKKNGKNLEVLSNWLGNSEKFDCSLRIDKTLLKDRKIFLYAGNMGVAQGLDIFLELATRLHSNPDVGFLFVGRGSEASRLRVIAQKRGLSNTLFYEEIEPGEMFDLCSQCHIGVVALDYRHKSHNIPGKFVAYMQAGLPVLANINAGNDLVSIIRDGQVGFVCESNRLDELEDLSKKILLQISQKNNFSIRCRELFDRYFSVEKAVRQISSSLIT